MPLSDIFGPKLLKREQEDGLATDSLSSVPVIGLYFSAKWCAPCKTFTPKLAKFYQEVNGEDQQIEIIYISGDQDEDDFDEYFGTMPWTAAHFDDDILDTINAKYQVSSIPTFIIINQDGSVKLKNGKELIESQGAGALDSFK